MDLHTNATAIDALPSLKQTLEQHGFRTKKSLGQHFLFDLQLINRIVTNSGDLTNKTVIEVGPGPGGLTRCLLRTNLKKLIVIECDPRCMPILAELKSIAGDRLEIIQADALTIDYQQLLSPNDPAFVIANLPYNVGTELIFTWLKNPSLFHSLTLMLQQEVVNRITASPKSREFGRLAVMSQWLCECYKIMDIHPSNFVPPPKVDSSVVQMIVRKDPAIVKNQSVLENIVRQAFGQRRKMLRASLKGTCDENTLNAVNIKPTDRPESLNVEDFIRLANHLAL